MFRASNQGENFVMSFQDIKLEVDATRNVDSFWTPAKRKKASIVEPGDMFEAYTKIFTSPEGKSQFKRAANSASLADSIVGLDTALGGLSLGVERLFKGAVEAIREIEDVADMGYRKVADLENVVGSGHLMDDSEFDHPTLWGSLATMGAKIVRLKGLKPPPAPSVDFGPLRAEVKNSQGGLVSSMTKISTFTRSFAKALLTRVTGLEEEMQRLKKVGKERDDQDFGVLLACSPKLQEVPTRPIQWWTCLGSWLSRKR
jgi:hypothetical protein